MGAAFKAGNKKLAASFAKRAMEYNPSANMVPQIQGVIAEAEKEAKEDPVPVQYNERNPFSLCAGSLVPIYRGGCFFLFSLVLSLSFFLPFLLFFSLVVAAVAVAARPPLS